MIFFDIPPNQQTRSIFNPNPTLNTLSPTPKLDPKSSNTPARPNSKSLAGRNPCAHFWRKPFGYPPQPDREGSYDL